MIVYARLSSEGTCERDVLRSVNRARGSLMRYDDVVSVELPSDEHEFLTLHGNDGLFNDVYQHARILENVSLHEIVIHGPLADDLSKVVRGSTDGAGFNHWSLEYLDAPVPLDLQERLELYRSLLDESVRARFLPDHQRL